MPKLPLVELVLMTADTTEPSDEEAMPAHVAKVLLVCHVTPQLADEYRKPPAVTASNLLPSDDEATPVQAALAGTPGTCVKLAPELVEMKTPPIFAPAIIRLPLAEAAMQDQLAFCEVTAVHEAPEFIETKMPTPLFAATNSLPPAARLMAVQLLPLPELKLST